MKKQSKPIPQKSPRACTSLANGVSIIETELSSHSADKLERTRFNWFCPSCKKGFPADDWEKFNKEKIIDDVRELSLEYTLKKVEQVIQECKKGLLTDTQATILIRKVRKIK